MRKNIILLFLIIAILKFFNACKEERHVEGAKKPFSVKVVKSLRKTIPLEMEFSGHLESVKKVEIIPRVSGYIVKREFKDGSLVKKGEVLYVIDQRLYKANRDVYASYLKMDRANLDFWTKEVKRYQEMLKGNATSVEKTQKAIARHSALLASVQKDKAELARSELELSFTTIYAPFSGVIGKTNYFVGDLVLKQSSILTTVVEKDPIYVIFNISHNQFFKIQRMIDHGFADKIKGMKVKIHLPDGSLYDQCGHIDYISSQIKPSTDSIMMRGVFKNEKDASGVGMYKLISGQYVPVVLVMGEQRDAVLVSKEGLVENQLGKFIYIVNDKNIVEERKVEVSSSFKSYWVIGKGVKFGEDVVIGGIQKIHSGEKVIILRYADGGR